MMSNQIKVRGELEKAKNLIVLCLSASEVIYGELAAGGMSGDAREICNSLVGGLIYIKSVVADIENLIDSPHEGNKP